MKCPRCKISGNMKKCKKCNSVYCPDCAVKGNGYPKVPRGTCPVCGKSGYSEKAK